MDPQSVNHPTFLPPSPQRSSSEELTHLRVWALSLECACPPCQQEFLSRDVAFTLPAPSCVISHTDFVCLTCQAAYCPRVWAAWILVTLNPFSSKETAKVVGVVFTFSFSFNKVLLWSSRASHWKNTVTVEEQIVFVGFLEFFFWVIIWTLFKVKASCSYAFLHFRFSIKIFHFWGKWKTSVAKFRFFSLHCFGWSRMVIISKVN